MGVLGAFQGVSETFVETLRVSRSFTGPSVASVGTKRSQGFSRESGDFREVSED